MTTQDSHQVETVDELRACVLSRLIGGFKARDGCDLDQAVRALLAYGGDGDAARRGTSAKPALRRLGMTRHELNEEWERLHFTDHERARFPDLVIEVFFPAEVWPHVDRLIRDGPRAAVRLIETRVYEYSRRTVRRSAARREGGRVLRRSVAARRQTYRRILRILVDLRALGFEHPALEPWVVVPPVRMPDIVPERTDRSAPPLDHFRAIVHELDERVNERLGADDGDKRAAITRLATAPLFQAGVVQELRDLLLLTLLATVSPRIGALAGLRNTDYDPLHTFPDGLVGPAICLYPGKTVHARLPRWKGLAPREAAILEAHMLARTRLFAERVPHGSSWRVLAEPRPMPEEWALFSARPFEPRKMPNPQSLSNRLSGQRRGFAIVPRARYSGSRVRGRTGHSSHAVRHLGDQLIRRAIEEHLERQGIRHITSAAIADIALDHSVREDRYGYSDLDSEHGREVWARRAALAASEFLWTDAGARKIPDLDAYRSSYAQRLRAEARLSEIDIRRRRLRRRVAAEASSLEALQEAVLLADEADALRRELDTAIERCRALEDDRGTWVPLAAGARRHDAEDDPHGALAELRAEAERAGGPGGRAAPAAAPGRGHLRLAASA